MTTLKQQIASDVSAVFLDTDEFAETWTQWPRGVEANAASVVVVPDLPMAERKTHRGEEQIQKPEIWVADSVTVHEKDVWIDEGATAWQAVVIYPVEGDMRRIEIQKNDKDHTSRPGSGQLL